METVALKCESCGAPLLAAPSATSVGCEFCHTKNLIRRGRVTPQSTKGPRKEPAEPWNAEAFTSALGQARSAPPPVQEGTGVNAVALFVGLLVAIFAVLSVVQPALGFIFLMICVFMSGTGLCVWAHHRNRDS